MDARRQQASELRHQIEWALARALDPRDVLPLLHRLARLAADGSDESTLREPAPGRAARRARPLARGALRPAGARPAPGRRPRVGHPGALPDAPRQLPLRRDRVPPRHRQRPEEPLVRAQPRSPARRRPGPRRRRRRLAASAPTRARRTAARWRPATPTPSLASGGSPTRARVLDRAMKRTRVARARGAAQVARAGRPGRQGPSATPPRPHPCDDRPQRGSRRSGPSWRAADPTPGSRIARRREPSSRRQIRSPLARRARRSARPRASPACRWTPSSARAPRPWRATPCPTSCGPRAPAGTAAVQAVAAAVAYAIVYVDHVPLTQAEVASCFRVGVASLRGRFGELRAHLDLMPGDARYATLRRR